MALDFDRARQLLHKFEFGALFIEVLGWSNPPSKQAVALEAGGNNYERRMIAELSGVAVYEITSADREIPDSKGRAVVEKQVADTTLEHLLVFVDGRRSQSLWYWVKREGSKRYPREHLYVAGQPGDLFLSKLSALVVDISELEDSPPSVIEMARRLQEGLDVERVTKRFFEEFQSKRLEFIELIEGITSEADRRNYASIILNRLMFVYFLQMKELIDQDRTYLRKKLNESQRRKPDQFFSEFLKTLFFEGLAKPEYERSTQTQKLIGNVKYLNGGLFLEHRIERDYDIFIPDRAFDNVLKLFEGFSWNLNDTPGAKDDEINPDVLGYIFEKYINQKAFGAYYTRPQITEYLCDRTINKLILDRINAEHVQQFDSISELLLRLDGYLCRRLLFEILPSLSLLDPACGSGAFLIAAMKVLIDIYAAIVGRIKVALTDQELTAWLEKIDAEHPSTGYFIKKRIITDNLYGVDIMEEATEIAKLRLFLAMVSSAQKVDDLEPLPNIDFNIMAGNSLIGLLRVDEVGFDKIGDSEYQQGNLLPKDMAGTYQQILEDKSRSIELYKKHSFLLGERDDVPQDDRLLQLRSHIDNLNRSSEKRLNQLLLDEFVRLGIKYEQAQLKGKAKKRALKQSDIEVLKPFHWGYHFDEVINRRGGFDAIITNPPWEIFKPNDKEFFAEYSDLVSKKKMDVKVFEKKKEKLLQEPETARAYNQYLSQYPYVSAYFRSAKGYKNQISIVNSKKVGTDINLYKLFLEQCFNLLAPGGRCGIIVPSGIYTDLGSKQLRQMLFSSSSIDNLFGLSNEKFIFDNVYHSFKICLLTFEKGKSTKKFEAAFRINPREAIRPDDLEEFFSAKGEHVEISVPMIRRLSPDSYSVMEFKSDKDIEIVEKMSRFPLLGEKIPDKWNLSLTSEFHMTNDSKLFKPYAPGRLPLYEGKMIHQFIHTLAEPRYWIDEEEGREALLRHDEEDDGQIMGYQRYRFAHRSIASSTNSRTLISTIVPNKVFCGHSLNVSSSLSSINTLLLVTSTLNSFCFDYFLRQQVSTNLTMFFLYQTPVPRITATDLYFAQIVERSAQLVCTTPEFDDLAEEIGLGSHKNGITNEIERAHLRAEMDGMIAHLYGLTEDELSHILSTFPIVPETTKIAVLNAYRDVERGLIK